MIDVPETWTGGIDDLVAEANRWLRVLLPEDRAQRPKDEVNPRLVRHYTTQGLLPAAGREGRDARYTRSHLFALLALRRLMADGLSGKALYAALRERGEAELERMAVQGGNSVQGLADDLELSEPQQSSGALTYLQRLKRQSVADWVSAPSVSVVPEAAPQALPAPKHVINRLGITVSPSVRVKKQLPQRLQRLEVRPGLEVLVGENFRYPRSDEEWTRLLAEIRVSLVDFQTS